MKHENILYWEWEYTILVLLTLCLAGALGLALYYHRKYCRQVSKHDQMLRQKILEAQEEERKRIARDLHDSVGQVLYSVAVGIKIVNQLKMDLSMREHMLEVEKLTERAMDEVKHMAFQLRPSVLDDLGLIPAIRTYLEHVDRTFAVETSFQYVGKIKRYESAVETALYRICQEAVSNAIKYSESSKVDVEVEAKEDEIRLQVKDYGKGFRMDHCSNGGIGLCSMVERSELLCGSTQIDAAPGVGTTIKVVIPASVYKSVS